MTVVPSATGAPGRTLDAETAQRVRFVAIDVDGVLTDGGIFLGDVDGRRMEFKKYDIQDGLGILLLRWAGIKVGIITGRVSESVALRAAELKVDELVQDEHARKLPALIKICKRLGIGLDEVAFIGDDLPDVGVLRAVGLPVVVQRHRERGELRHAPADAPRRRRGRAGVLRAPVARPR